MVVAVEKANPDVKRLWLEACFEEIQVGNKEVSGFRYRAPFDRLVDPGDGSSSTSGSNKKLWLARLDSNQD